MSVRIPPSLGSVCSGPSAVRGGVGSDMCGCRGVVQRSAVGGRLGRWLRLGMTYRGHPHRSMILSYRSFEMCSSPASSARYSAMVSSNRPAICTGRSPIRSRSLGDVLHEDREHGTASTKGTTSWPQGDAGAQVSIRSIWYRRSLRERARSPTLAMLGVANAMPG